MQFPVDDKCAGDPCLCSDARGEKTVSFICSSPRLAAAIASTATLLFCSSSLAAATINLQTAANFTVLGSSTVTNTGATTIYGDLGVAPGTAITGLGKVTLTGAVHSADAVATLARAQAIGLAANLAGLTPTIDLSGQDLGSVGALTPGVYKFGSSAQLTGSLTLDFAGNANSAFIFQIGSGLTTASGANANILGGGPGSGVFWNVGSAATLGTGSNFAGNILAGTSITFDTGATLLCGRAIALTGAVTLDGNSLSNDCGGAGALGSGRTDFGSNGFAGAAGPVGAVPEPASWAMMITGFGLAGTMLRRRPNMASLAG
jgi:type VI secretion system secreted protein VgrG